MPVTRILLIDDHSLFRESLSRLLGSEMDIAVVGTCSSAEEAVRALEAGPVDLVLLDYDLGEEQGSAFLERAQAVHYAGKILLVTAGMSDQDAESALQNGASGLFLKHSPPGKLLEAIHRVMAGETWLDSAAARSLAATASERSAGKAIQQQPLTPRELSVLKGIFAGLTNKEIGGNLLISEGSVKAAIQQLFDKTGVRTRSQLVRIALERRLDN